MSHWRTSRAILGGGDRSPGSHSAHDTQRGSKLLPTVNLTFPRGNFAQTMLDILALFFWTLLVCVTGAGIAVALFILFFVGVH